MTTPKPGAPARGSTTGRPIMALLDLLGRRMALRILWELSRSEAALTFRALESAAETNPAVLNTRLKELRAAGIVAHGEGGYALTEAGAALMAHLRPVGDWAKDWAARGQVSGDAAEEASARQPISRR